MVVTNFRIYAKNFSLTYPQCSATKEALLQHLQQLQPVHIIVATELHQDGNTHHHVSISFQTRKNLRSQTFFDYQQWHPNIQATRNLNQWITYVKKDGIFLEEGIRPAAETATRRTLIDLDSVDSKELRNYCVNNKVGYGYYLEEKKKRETVDTTIHNETSAQGTMSWYLQCLQLPTSKCVVLTGATGIGKTTWALKNSPKPCLVVTHLDQLKKFQPTVHQAIIFDDMSFHHLPVTSQIHLTDNDLPRAIHIRYGTALIPANVTKIFTCNDYPFSMHEAIQRRVKHINANETIINID